MGSVRNKRHAGRQHQHQHQAAKKRKHHHRHHHHHHQQQQQRQNLRLTIALTKSGGVELKKQKQQQQQPRKSGGGGGGVHRCDEVMSDQERCSSADPSPSQQRSESAATADLAAEEQAEEQATTSSPLTPPVPQVQDDLHGDVNSDHDSSATVDAYSLVSMETVPEQRITKKVVMAAKSEDESEEGTEEDQQPLQQQQKIEDYEKRRQSSDQSEVDGDSGLSVTCGENVARLYLSKLRLIARERVQSQCIRFDGTWLTPNEFQRESGREAAKDWKRTIRHNGLCLKQLLSDGIFDFSVAPPVCLCVTCAAAAAASTRRGRDATTNEEMEISAPHPSSAFETAATPDQEQCLISGLGSAAAAAAATVAAAAAYRSGDGDKKEKRRRRSKQRPVKEKRKTSSTTTTTTTSTSSSTSSASACLLTDDPATFRAPDNSTRKRKSFSGQFDRRPTAELTDVEETFERLAAQADEMTAKSDALNGLTKQTDQVTLDLGGLATMAGLVTTELDGMTTDATPPAPELYPAMPVLAAPDGDTKCQDSGLIPKKKRRKKCKKNSSSIEISETQQVTCSQDFIQPDGHSIVNPKISDDRWSLKENQNLKELIGEAAPTHVKQDDCNMEANTCFQALSICGEVQKQTCSLNEDQQITSGKYDKIVDGDSVCETGLSAEAAVIRDPYGLESDEMATLTAKCPSHVNSGDKDGNKNIDFRGSSHSVAQLREENVSLAEIEDQAREVERRLDDGDIPHGFLSSADQQVCSKQQDLDKSEIDSGMCESIHNIPTMPLNKEDELSFKSASVKAEFSEDGLNSLVENPPSVGVQPDRTSTSISDQSARTSSVSEAATGGLPANASSSRNPHLVAVIAELKQKKQLTLSSGVRKKKEAGPSVSNSDQSKATGGVSCLNANDAKLSFDVASRFLAAAANSSLSSSPPYVVDNAPVSSISGLCQTQKSSEGSANLTQSMIGVISKAGEGQTGSSVTKHKTKTASASGGRTESNRKRSSRPLTAEGKTGKAPDGGRHVTSGKDASPSIPLSLPSGLYGLSPSQLASLPFPASPYSLFPPYLFMGFPLQPLIPSCPTSDGKLSSFGMGQGMATSSGISDQPQAQPAPPPPPGSRKRRSNQSGRSSGQKSRRGSQSMTPGAAPAGTNPIGPGADKTATSDLLNSMMAFDLLRSRIGISPPAGPGLDSPKSAPFYFPWLKPDPSKTDVLFGGGGAGGPSSSSLLRTMTSEAKLQQAATRTLAAPNWSEAFLQQQHEQHSKRPKTGDFRPYDPMSCVIDRKATPPLFSPDFKRRRRDKASLPSTDQKPFSLAASEHCSLPESHFYDDVGALDLSLK